MAKTWKMWLFYTLGQVLGQWQVCGPCQANYSQFWDNFFVLNNWTESTSFWSGNSGICSHHTLERDWWRCSKHRVQSQEMQRTMLEPAGAEMCPREIHMLMSQLPVSPVWTYLEIGSLIRVASNLLWLVFLYKGHIWVQKDAYRKNIMMERGCF
jgi:hypothetical protein